MPPALTVSTALSETLALLWPGCQAEAITSSRRDPAARTELLAFPDLRRQRLLLPASPRAAGAALRRFSSAVGRVEVGGRTAAAAALRYGATSLLRQRIRLHGGDDDTIEEHLAAVLGRERVQVSLSLGPPRVNRKPVLQVFDAHGRSLGFAKIGTAPAAAAVVTAEADALAALAQRDHATLRVPRLLSRESWRGMPVLVQSDLAVSAAPLLRRRVGVPTTAMAQLVGEFAEAPLPLAQSPWWRECRRRGEAAADPRLAERLRSAMETVAARHPEPVPTSAWHGDWTSWNTAPGRGDVLLVWDWERFETGVPDGLDPVHYAVNEAVTRRGTETAVLVEAVRGSAPDTRTGLLYLVAVAARYLEMTGEAQGDLVSQRTRVTLAALESLLATTA